ncbi:MAG: AraC family transcriptional regulator [Rivularia sp. (in: cyanobacteria)]
MASDKIIAVNFSQEKATSQVLSHPNRLSSHQAAWDGMYLEYHDSPSHETPEHYPTQHVIAIQTKGIVEAERKLANRFQQEQIHAGDVCVVPLQDSNIPPEDAKIKQAKDYIHAHLNEKLSLKAIAATIGMSQYHFCRVFKETTGLTAWQYVIKKRIELAKQLLKIPQLSIVEISYQYERGYTDYPFLNRESVGES